MDALARAARDRPDAPALVVEERVITYAELDAAARGVAALVRSSGSLGSHAVAFWGDRTPETVAAVWGIPRAGVAAVPVDPRTAPARAMAATRAAGVRGLWTPPSGGFDRLVGAGVAPLDAAAGEYVVFTSGSEGEPKGVRITPENIAASVEASRRRLGHGPDDAWLCVLPLFHVGGLAILWRQAASAAPVLLHERFDPATAASAFADAAFASFVPVMLRRVLAHAPLPVHRLRAVLVGGAASDPALLTAARTAGIPVVPTYGMTETASQVATPFPNEPLDGTVGTALEGAEIRVVRDGSQVVGEEGRIEVRGPMVSPGYVGETERPPSSWHVTGDMGVIDGRGRLTVVGRADDVIVTGGINVHPVTVERMLMRHPGVQDARVFGVSDPEWGSVVAADVVLVGADLEEIEEWARSSLPASMRPRRVSVVPTIARKLDDGDQKPSTTDSNQATT